MGFSFLKGVMCFLFLKSYQAFFCSSRVGRFFFFFVPKGCQRFFSPKMKSRFFLWGVFSQRVTRFFFSWVCQGVFSRFLFLQGVKVFFFPEGVKVLVFSFCFFHKWCQECHFFPEDANFFFFFFSWKVWSFSFFLMVSSFFYFIFFFLKGVMVCFLFSL